eukprot:TRINITY_DN2472_c0_g1_i4.p1 TRINITY_DN2472_c0_g1~~TRINITY_DN2472_c0_g1_i4.p1  ORF type:complete len:521 (+),score=200.31 TRINITY_DN2472_c0_g1_i4:103-1563(+)
MLAAALLLAAAAADGGRPGPVSARDMGGVGPETVANFAGYVTVNKTRNLFYWFFESRSAPATDPFVLWMTGGPGCSGQLALFVENGPYHVSSEQKLSLNPYSWNTKANILYIDQPVGTGFSYDSSATDIGVINEEQMALNMWEFFQHWFTANPKYAQLRFFIAAESYGGHYAPALAHMIQQKNSAGEGAKINLAGVLIGDGLVDPYNQYAEYPAFAKSVQHAKGFGPSGLSQSMITIMEGGLAGCLPLISACENWNASCNKGCSSPVTPDGSCAPPKDDPHGLPCCYDSTGVPCINETLHFLACSNAYDACNLAELIPIQGTGVNLYDVRLPCSVKPLCYDFSAVTTWLDAHTTDLGAHKAKWSSCNRVVEMKLVFAGDWMLGFQQYLPPLLAANVPVLIYHGDQDFIVNWMGGQRWTKAMKWSGQAGFISSPNVTYTVGSSAVGSYKTHQGFTFMKIAGAGHMVPRDQPQVALDMLNKFMAGQPW